MLTDEGVKSTYIWMREMFWADDSWQMKNVKSQKINYFKDYLLLKKLIIILLNKLFIFIILNLEQKSWFTISN